MNLKEINTYIKYMYIYKTKLLKLLTWPYCPFGHISSHFVPIYPFWQMHSPENGSQVELFEQSHVFAQCLPYFPGGHSEKKN